MNPNIPGYAQPPHSGDSRPSLQVNTTVLHPGYPIPAYNVGPSQPGYHIPRPNPHDPNVYGTHSPSSTLSPTPASSASVTHADDSSPKRKRSRVTPEQLARLEDLFASDRSPTVSRRKEISAELGMRERQTQIWFQNRRAKAKVQEGRGKPRAKKGGSGKNRSKSGVTSPSSTRSPQDLSPDEDEEDEDEENETPISPVPPGHPHYERYLAHRFGESGPISVIPCHAIKIGDWPTVPDLSKGREIVAFIAQRQGGPTLVMVWFFTRGGQSYKLEVPVPTIENTHVGHGAAGPGDPYPVATAHLRLSRLPTFWVLPAPARGRSSTPTSASRPQNQPTWSPCPDFTQGGSAASARVYEMQGPAYPMVQILRTFPNFSQEVTASPGLMRAPHPQGPGGQPGIPAVPLLPNLPQGAMGGYAGGMPPQGQPYPQATSSQHPSYQGRSVSGPTSMMHAQPYLQPPPMQQRHTSYQSGHGSQPTFAFDVTSMSSQGFNPPVSAMSDPGASQPSTEYSTPGTRPFTAETLTTPFFPDMNSPVFQEAAQQLLADESNHRIYSPYSQHAHYSPSNAQAHPGQQMSPPTQSYPGPSSYAQPYGPQGQHTATEYSLQYSGPRSAPQQIPMQPPGSGHGYPTPPSSTPEGRMGYRRPSNPQ